MDDDVAKPMEDTSSRAWFDPPRWGSGNQIPIRWQGWALSIAFVTAMGLTGLYVKGHTRLDALAVEFAVYFVISLLKTNWSKR